MGPVRDHLDGQCRAIFEHRGGSLREPRPCMLQIADDLSLTGTELLDKIFG